MADGSGVGVEGAFVQNTGAGENTVAQEDTGAREDTVAQEDTVAREDTGARESPRLSSYGPSSSVAVIWHKFTSYATSFTTCFTGIYHVLHDDVSSSLSVLSIS